MAQEIKTLVQVAEDIENGNNLREYYNNDGAQIKAGQFGSFADFISYYNQHYRPILQAIADGGDLTAQPAQLLRFMASDLLELFADTDEDEQEEIAVVEITFDSAKQYANAKHIFDSDGPSSFWAGDWNDDTRTIEFTDQGDPEPLRIALDAELTKYRISGYTFDARTVRV